jgi:DNA primase large subunit
MELAFCSKYPFSKEAKELVSSAKVSDEFRLVEMAKERVVRAIRDGVIPAMSFELDESQVVLQVASYAMSRMIVSLLGSRYYIGRYSIAEAKRAGRYMEGDSDENVLKVAAELGVGCEVDGEYAVRFEKYLIYAPKSVDYKLVNRKLSNGVVRLRRSEFIRMLEEAVKMKIESELPLKVKDVPENIRKTTEAVRASIPKEPVPTNITKGDFPPCINKLLEDLKTVENLGHTARWTLAVYLLNVGMKVEEVVRVFSTSPDFDEKVTRYQVEHAMKRGYRMPSCANMDSNGLCVANCGVKNPLAYRRGGVGRNTAASQKP